MSGSLHSKQYDAFTQVLVEARRTAGLTQVELAARLQRPQSYVSKYERRERRLDVVEFVAVANALRVDPVRLFRLVADAL